MTQQFEIFVQNKPGDVSRIAEALSRNSVNIRGISTDLGSPRPMMHIVTDDDASTRSALRAANMSSLRERSMSCPPGPPRSFQGDQGAVQIGINIESMFILGTHGNNVSESPSPPMTAPGPARSCQVHLGNASRHHPDGEHQGPSGQGHTVGHSCRSNMANSTPKTGSTSSMIWRNRWPSPSLGQHCGSDERGRACRCPCTIPSTARGGTECCRPSAGSGEEERGRADDHRGADHEHVLLVLERPLHVDDVEGPQRSGAEDQEVAERVREGPMPGPLRWI